MDSSMSPRQKALTLAAVSGLKTTLGPALVMAGQRRTGWKMAAMAAMGEMVLDKLPFMPSRRSLPLLLPRAVAGYWAAKASLEADGVEDPQACAMGAAVAAGVATFAPMVRGTASTILGMPNALMGAMEDYLALKVGGEAAGLSMDQIKQIAQEAVYGFQEEVGPLIGDVRERLEPAQ
jgi:alpha-beta hydrolase superfamily lysophospholipase